MASNRFTAEAYIDSECSEELDSDELQDSESLDGDREIADYTNSQGGAEVVLYSGSSRRHRTCLSRFNAPTR